MGVQVGDSIPEATMNIMGEKGPQEITTSEIFGGKKVVLFAVPGAFTPTCSAYMIEAVRKYGFFRGSLKGVRRISRCHPWNKGGHDPP